MRRAPVHLPAYGFTFRGRGRSYETSGHVPHPDLRSDEGVAVRRRDGGLPLDFSYPPTEGDEAGLVLELQPGEWLELGLELGAGAWVVTVQTDGVDLGHGPVIDVLGSVVSTILVPWAGVSGGPPSSSSRSAGGRTCGSSRAPVGSPPSDHPRRRRVGVGVAVEPGVA